MTTIYHHSASARGYCRVCDNYREEYNGRFGRGYILHYPSLRYPIRGGRFSTNYHLIEYYIFVDTLQDFARYINGKTCLPLSSFDEVITENNWISDLHIPHGICHDDTHRLVFKDGKAIITTL